MRRNFNSLLSAVLSIVLAGFLVPSLVAAETPASIESRILSLEQRIKALEDQATKSNSSQSIQSTGLSGCRIQNIKPAVIPNDDYNAKLSSSTAEARGVPYFRDGKQVGLRLFAIKQNGIVEASGLKNGDVILLLDGEFVGEVNLFFSKMFIQREASTPATRLCVERGGREVAIAFKVE